MRATAKKQKSVLRSLREAYADMFPTMAPAGDPVLDVVQVFSDGRLHFPTICTCLVCHGVTACSDPRKQYGGVIKGPLALQIATLQHGYYMAKWEGQNVGNTFDIPYACSCTCEHEWSSETIRMCEHRVTCTKCGHTQIVDSSD